MKQLTFEEYAKTHSHAIYRIIRDNQLLLDYVGSYEECNNLLHARMAGAWAMVVNDPIQIKLWYERKYKHYDCNELH